MKKLPQITALFWVTKIAATTLGETGGDLLAQTLHIGYAVSSLLFISLFLFSLTTQLKAKRFHPALYWTVIVSTSTAGTTMSDFMNRSAGLGYAKGALILMACLAGVFAIWRRSGQTFSVEQISTSEASCCTGSRSCSPTRSGLPWVTSWPTPPISGSSVAPSSSAPSWS